MKKHLLIVVFFSVFLTPVFVIPASFVTRDEITEMRVKVIPETAMIRPLETAVIKLEFFGMKKKGGFFGSLLGGKAEHSELQSSDWKIGFEEQAGGWLSKRFLYQDRDEKGGDPRTRRGFGNFIIQGIGAASAKNAVLYTAPAKPGRYSFKVINKNLSKVLTITVSARAASSKPIEKVSFRQSPKPKDPYLYLVEHYAPFIAQETWFEPKADYLARFDYDGNWKGEDNWENLEHGSSQAFVYYGVTETSTHWFLIYNFFHARDYSDICVVGTCHENDNEGMILTVRKGATRFGTLEVMETLAHNNIYSFTNNRRIKKRAHNIDGRLPLYKKSHPIIFIEAGGHGVYGAGARASLFSAETMSFRRNTGITYVYGKTAGRPRHPNDRNISYALLPIYKEWWERGNQPTDEANDTFDKFFSYEPFGGRPRVKANFIAGSFRGRTASKNMAKPFWGWHDRKTKKKKILNTGQWALDPAYAVSRNLKFPKDMPVSTVYIFNPYLEKEASAVSRP